METIKEEKERLRSKWDDGTKCKCCNQQVKRYKRKIGNVGARMLIRLYHLPDDFNHVKEICKGISDTGTNDFSKLLYWGLITQKPNEDETKRTSGYWKITDKGAAFVDGRIVVEKYALVYNQKVWGFSDDTASIQDALGTKFNYNELMKNI